MNDPSKTYANPFIVCEQCGKQATWREPSLSTVTNPPGLSVNVPCGHAADSNSVCPSWGPVDGCQCQDQLGYIPHVSEVPKVGAP